MATQNSKRNTNGVKNEINNAAKQVNNNASNSTRRVVETRDQWVVIFDYAVSLVVAYTRGHKPEGDLRKGFAFGPTSEQPHSRAYAKSLIWGFATSKAGKVLKNLDEVADKSKREKIATAILVDAKLVKGDTDGVKKQLNAVTPKRERVFAEAVLAELTKPESKKATTKGGKKSETKKSTTNGGRKSATKQAAK